MTGYGRGECAQDGFKVTVELGSVNRRQSEISVNLPRELELLETQIRDVINRNVSRGRVTVRVSIHTSNGRLSAQAHINLNLAKAYTTELRKLAKQLKLSGDLTLDQVLRAPGVFQTDEELVDAEEIWPAVEKALNQALAAMLKMREREGGHLTKDLAARTTAMRRAVEKIRLRAPLASENHRQSRRSGKYSAG
jgi:uncharacterized protein (TIGR00255 family)